MIPSMLASKDQFHPEPESASRKLSSGERLSLIGSPSVDGIQFSCSLPENSPLLRRWKKLFSTNTLDKIERIFNDPKEKRRKMHEKYVIKANNKFKLAFDAIIGVLIIYSVVGSLYYMSFDRDHSKDRTLDNVVWAFFVLDLILTFFTEKVNKNGYRILNISMIAKHYASRLMVFDLAALMPLSWAGHPNIEYSLRLLRILRLGSLYKMVNIRQIAKKIGRLLAPGKMKKKKKITLLVLNAWELIKNLLVILFFSYCLACMWYYYVDFIARDEHPTNNFISNYGLDKKPRITALIETWYFIFSTLSTTGFGDYDATNKYEIAMNIALCIIGPSFFAYIAGKVINIVNDLRTMLENSNNTVKLSLWLSATEKKYNRIIPYSLKKKINSHFINYWKNDRLGSLGSFIQETETNFSTYIYSDVLFSSLPDRLKHQVLNYLFDDVFYKFSYFFNIKSNWKYKVAVYLQPRFYTENQIILDINKDVHEVIFMIMGQIEISITDGQELHFICLQEKSSIIGDYFLFIKMPSFLQYRTKKLVQAFAIPGFALKELVKENEEHFEMYFQVVSQNIEEIVGSVNRMVTEPSNSSRLGCVPRGSMYEKVAYLNDMEDNEGKKNEVPELDLIVRKMHIFRQKTLKASKERLLELLYPKFCVSK
jgi:hypothetical protein